MQVPVLTRDSADHVPVNGLVRFRGMVSLTPRPGGGGGCWEGGVHHLGCWTWNI
jgi:hypothetical protein